MKYKSLSSFAWKFIRQQKWAFLGSLAFSMAWPLDTVLWPYLLGWVIDICGAHDTAREAAWVALKTPIACGILLWIGIEVCFRGQGFLLARNIPKLEANIRMEMFDHVQRHSPKYFNENFAGSLANKITDMTSEISEILQKLIWMIIPATVACILSLVFFAAINPLFAMLLGLMVVSYSVVFVIFVRKCTRYEHTHSETRSVLLGKIVDSLTNNFAVNLFYRFSYEKNRIGALQRKEEKQGHVAKRQVELLRLFLSLTFLTCGMTIYGLMIHLWIKGTISAGDVVQIFNMVWNITMILWMTGIEIPMLIRSYGAAKQALSIMNDPQDILDVPHAKPLVVTKGEIAFHDVSFRYGQRYVFQNKNITIQSGERVGLVGFSGAGKSTFVNLILRFFPIEKGRITIDGQDIAEVSLESLRQQVALIPQEPILFHRSLGENICYGKMDVTKKEMVAAAKLTHCDEFIGARADGYDTIVGERGTKLSGGEKQRIAIARAMLADSPILILDEATSALDSVTESYIQASLEKLMKDRTTIVVAHRLSTLAKMDRILVFDKGKIVEEGSHQTLLAKEGHYAKLWHMQAGGFLPDKPLS